MAEKEKKTKEDETLAEGTKKKSSMMLIIIIIAVLVVGGGGTAAFFMLKAKPEKKIDLEAVKKQENIKLATLGPVIMLDTFIVNLSGAAGRNYLKVEMGFELSDEKVRDEVENKMLQIKDSVLMIISSVTYDDIKTVDGKLMLKETILRKINGIINTGTVASVYFAKFVVQ